MGKSKVNPEEVDLTLAVLCVISHKTGYQFSFTEIGDITGMTKQAIRQAEERGRLKLWRRLNMDKKFVAEINEHLGHDRTNNFILPPTGGRSRQLSRYGRSYTIRRGGSRTIFR